MPTPSHAPVPYRVGRSSAGLGLFATDIIEKGKFIIEYDGPRISNAELEKSTSERYFFEVNNRWTIDGTPRWNTARYINHSCRPNAEPHEIRGRIKIKAKRRIRPGEEITYNYGKDYFEQYIGKHCRCVKCVEQRAAKRAAKRSAR